MCKNVQCRWDGVAPCPIHNQYEVTETHALSKFTVVLNRHNDQACIVHVHVEVDDCSHKNIKDAAYKQAADHFLCGDEDYWRAKSTVYFIFSGHHQSLLK